MTGAQARTREREAANPERLGLHLALTKIGDNAVVPVVHKHVRGLREGENHRSAAEISGRNGSRGYETRTHLEVTVEYALAVQICHAFRDLVDHLEEIHAVERWEALQVRHEGAVLVIRANEEPGRVARGRGRA